MKYTFRFQDEALEELFDEFEYRLSRERRKRELRKLIQRSYVFT